MYAYMGDSKQWTYMYIDIWQIIILPSQFVKWPSWYMIFEAATTTTNTNHKQNAFTNWNQLCLLFAVARTILRLESAILYTYTIPPRNKCQLKLSHSTKAEQEHSQFYPICAGFKWNVWFDYFVYNSEQYSHNGASFWHLLIIIILSQSQALSVYSVCK